MNEAAPILPQSPVDPVEHGCRHPDCDKWGAWGYDSGRGVAGWWCLEHRPGSDPVVPEVEQSWISDGHEG